MTVGAVMPTYNQAQFIDEAIGSLVGQVHTLAIVDDGSTDATFVRIGKWYSKHPNKIVLLKHQHNQRTAAAINTGIEYLRRNHTHRWLTWVSSDNVHYSHWMTTLLAAADENTGAVYSAFDARGEVKPHRSYRAYNPIVLGKSIACYFGPSFIIRADVWQDHRGKTAHDYDNWCRVEEACWAAGLKIVGVEEALCMYRVHRQMATKARRGEFDAPHWLQECQQRRKALGIKPPA